MTTPVPSAATRVLPASIFVTIFLAILLAILLALPTGMLSSTVLFAAQAPRPDTAGTGDTPATIAGCLVMEADFVRATGMRSAAPGVDLNGQVILIDRTGGAFSVNGTRERDLVTRVGSRVEVSGTLEAWSSGVSFERLPEDAPLSAPPHEPGDSAETREARPVLTPPTLQRINVRSFHAVEGACAPIVTDTARDAGRNADGSERPAVTAARAPVATGPLVERVRAQGCVLRDPAGTERIVLGQATIRRPDVVAASAVPGSGPSGTGSGTTPAPRVTGASGAMQSFYLNGQDKTIATLLGSRAEVVGTLSTPTAAAGQGGDAATTSDGVRQAERATTAHPSAPVRALTVESVRAIGGSCAP